MAKYKSGEEAEVGDIVKCVVPKSPIDGYCDLEGDCTYKVVRTSQSHIHVADKVLYSSRFELISRATSPEPEHPAVKHEQSPPLVDFVNHPPHYAALVPEPVDVIEAWQLEWHEGNALKYIARSKSKGERVQDLRKAAWYLNRKAEMLEKNYNQPME